METSPNYLMIALRLLGALGLLIYGMRMMSEALQKIAGPQLRRILAKMTTNRLSGMLTGTAVTCAVQSSSATTVMTVSFVSAGLLTLSQAISVIMGANIGTTLTAWIMSLGYNLDLTNVVFPAFFVGIILIYYRSQRFVGDFLFGIAFMFLSLVMLSSAGRDLDLAHNEAAMNFFSSFDTQSHLSILIFLAIGTLITCIVQSSAAVMAITILLCSTGVLPIHLGIALVMGENIGTTATANLAALGAGTDARRAALAHLLFNVFGVIWVLIVFYPFVGLVCSLVGYNPEVAGQTERLPVVLAMFHTCFNLANTALLIGFIPQIERIVCWILPKKDEPDADDDFRLKYIQANLVQTPEIAILQAQREIQRFAETLHQMFDNVRKLPAETKDDRVDEICQQISQQEQFTDRMEIEIARFLEQVASGHLSDNSKQRLRQMMREIGELESIGDACFNLSRIMSRSHHAGLRFTKEQLQRLNDMENLCQQALNQMALALTGNTTVRSTRETYRLENDINQMHTRLKAANVEDIGQGRYSYALGTVFDDTVGQLERMGDYIVNVVEARFS